MLDMSPETSPRWRHVKSCTCRPEPATGTQTCSRCPQLVASANKTLEPARPMTTSHSRAWCHLSNWITHVERFEGPCLQSTPNHWSRASVWHTHSSIRTVVVEWNVQLRLKHWSTRDLDTYYIAAQNRHVEDNERISKKSKKWKEGDNFKVDLLTSSPRSMSRGGRVHLEAVNSSETLV